MKLSLLVVSLGLVAAGSSLSPALRAAKAAIESGVLKKAPDGAAKDTHGRLLASAICDDTNGLAYAVALLLYGESLITCLCANNLLEDDQPTPSTSQLCNCKAEMKASVIFKTGPDPDITDSDIDNACPDSDDPCFARDTFALSPSGHTIPMAALRSGDLVMDGPSSTTRVIVNQHRAATFKSSLLEITHANGKLSLTPDHVLEVDGDFVPARNAAPGSMLGDSEVSHAVYTSGKVINPITASGKILAQDGVLATTYPEWIAEYMLSSYLVPLPLSLSNALSYLFPETTQAYYDAVIEPLVTRAHPKHLKSALPSTLLPVAFFAGDLAVSAGFVGFVLASPMMVAAVLAAVAVKSRK